MGVEGLLQNIIAHNPLVYLLRFSFATKLCLIFTLGSLSTTYIAFLTLCF